jgi:DNA-binding GntR family transcriptional regulator
MAKPIPPHLLQKRNRSVADRVALDLAYLIETNVYKPGDRLREVELSERFKVSRAPVREALRILATRSLVHIEPMKGATVARLSDQEARESVEISGVLFGLAARKAAVHRNDQDIQVLWRQIERLESMAGEGVEPDEFFRQTLRAGFAVLDAAKGSRLRSLILDVRAGAAHNFGPYGFTTQVLRVRAAQRWRDLADAIVRGDGDEADRQAQLTHVDSLTAALKITA